MSLWSGDQKIVLTNCLLSRMRKRTKISWTKWEEMSKKAVRSDTWGHGCGHRCIQIPFTYEFVMKTGFIFLQALSCPLLEECEAIDEWHYHQDFLYIRKYEPPLVRPVNYSNGLVLNAEGQIMGPTTHSEWLIHSQKLLDIFFELITGILDAKKPKH